MIYLKVAGFTPRGRRKRLYDFLTPRCWCWTGSAGLGRLCLMLQIIVREPEYDRHLLLDTELWTTQER